MIIKMEKEDFEKKIDEELSKQRDKIVKIMQDSLMTNARWTPYQRVLLTNLMKKIEDGKF